MKPLALLFALIGEFVPVDRDDLLKMENDAEKWEAKQIDNPSNKIGELYAKYSREWYVRLALAVAYIPLYKWLQDLMFSRPDEQREVV